MKNPERINWIASTVFLTAALLGLASVTEVVAQQNSLISTSVKTSSKIAVGQGASGTGSTRLGLTGSPSVGYTACLECHQSKVNIQSHTKHARAFVDPAFAAAGGQTDRSCLPCHTVSGFVSASATPQLAGVQCESCHGGAANHAANPGDTLAVPKVSVAATVCGQCHSGPMQPTYEEWSSSEHAQVTSGSMSSTTCGRCHQGPAHIALVTGQPVPPGSSNLGIVCASCHDPHAEHTYKNVLNGVIAFTNTLTGNVTWITNNQLGATYTSALLNPLASLKDFVVGTSGSAAAKYDSTINICAQCHSHRGGTWTDSSAPPHHSPQYNVLLGTVGVMKNGVPPRYPATHSRLEKQCAACHMQTAEYQPGPPATPAKTGHTFEVTTYSSCAPCHRDAENAENLVTFVQNLTTNSITTIKAGLDQWALTKAPAALRNKYGTRAWEYTIPGDLSPGGPGPNKTEQLLIPNAIKKARFNLYLVLYDGSLGVHNGPYSSTLLNDAYEWVQTELHK